MDNKNISYAGFCAVSVKILNPFFLFNVSFSSAEVGGKMSICRKPSIHPVSLSYGIISSLSVLFLCLY